MIKTAIAVAVQCIGGRTGPCSCRRNCACVRPGSHAPDRTARFVDLHAAASIMRPGQIFMTQGMIFIGMQRRPLGGLLLRAGVAPIMASNSTAEPGDLDR